MSSLAPIRGFRQVGDKDKPDRNSAVFKIGERIPLKGLWFRVKACAGAELLLEVVGATGKRKPKRKSKR